MISGADPRGLLSISGVNPRGPIYSVWGQPQSFSSVLLSPTFKFWRSGVDPRASFCNVGLTPELHFDLWGQPQRSILTADYKLIFPSSDILAGVSGYSSAEQH